jgi:hypothetical protein
MPVIELEKWIRERIRASDYTDTDRRTGRKHQADSTDFSSWSDY